MVEKKDQPWRWTKYENNLCKSCVGTCCTLPVEVKAEDLVRLELIDPGIYEQSLKKAEKLLKKMGIVKQYRQGTGLFMLQQKANDDCVFLDSKSRLCTVYEKRPSVCREFPRSIGPRPGFCPHERK